MPAMGLGIFGEVELIDSRHRSSNARAASAAELVCIERDELLEILFKSPEKSLMLGKAPTSGCGNCSTM